uniref:Tetraspanin n=1 Tax=Macrostomum lignano TaxID=282301 RepID=A0A1I8G826_9PLAT
MLSSEAIRHIGIVTYSANILLGIISLTFYGITIATNPYLTVGESFTFKGGGLIKIFSSLANITIGILGIVGVVQNWRILLKIGGPQCRQQLIHSRLEGHDKGGGLPSKMRGTHPAAPPDRAVGQKNPQGWPDTRRGTACDRTTPRPSSLSARSNTLGIRGLLEPKLRPELPHLPTFQIVCILACAVVTNVVILVMHLTNRNTLTKSDINEYREKLTKQYGEDEGVTSFLNNGQEEELCCGWSGDEKENLFLQSPWYKLVNANVTGKKTTLPDSCCLEPGPKCQQAENLKEAREKKYVHKYAMCVASTMVSIMGPAE